MPPELPANAVCLGCGYPLRGLTSAVCPECGRPFSLDDRRTYEVRRPPREFRFTPLLVGWGIVALYAVYLILLGMLDPGDLKSTACLRIQPVVMLTVVGSAVAFVVWAWRRREQRVGALALAALLLLAVLGVHLSSYLAWLRDVAEVRRLVP